MLALFVRIFLLTQATHAPQAHVYAAIAAETPELPAELLLAQGWKESRWTTDAVSRIEIQPDGTRARRMGTWRGKFPSRFRGPYFCGASQLRRTSEKACRAIGVDLLANYQEAREHIEEWLAFCKKTGHPGDLDCALAGYGGGVKAAKSRSKGYRAWRYGLSVQRLAKTYRRKMEKLLTNGESS